MEKCKSISELYSALVIEIERHVGQMPIEVQDNFCGDIEEMVKWVLENHYPEKYSTMNAETIHKLAGEVYNLQGDRQADEMSGIFHSDLEGECSRCGGGGCPMCDGDNF